MRFVGKGSLGLLLALSAAGSVSCGGFNNGTGNSYTSPTTPSGFSATITPGTLTIAPAQTFLFSAVVHGPGTFDRTIQWSCSAGNIDQSGRFTSPPLDGILTVTAQPVADPRAVAICRVTVAG